MDDIISAGDNICSAPEDIQCRDTLSQHAQNVTCTPQRGFSCFNYKQLSQQCDDYQARVKCCHCQPVVVTGGETTRTQPTSPQVCSCHHNGASFSVGSVVYNVSDQAGCTYTGYCNDSCQVEIRSYTCQTTTTTTTTTTASTTTPRPTTTTTPTTTSTTTPRPTTTTTPTTTSTTTTTTISTTPYYHNPNCTKTHPHRESGESWLENKCLRAHCFNQTITYEPLGNDCPDKPVCANGFPSVPVNSSGCCDQEQCQCVCYGWGDPHYVTFDGTYYSFQGVCSYWLVKEIVPTYNFSVLIDNYACGNGQSCPGSIVVFYRSYTIRITQETIDGVPTSVVNVNDKRVNAVAYKNEDFVITTTKGINTQMLVPAIGAKVTFSGLIFSVSLAYDRFHGNTQGQCGTCDNNKDDDCMLPSGKIASSCPGMANEWRLNDTCGVPPTPGPTPGPCHPDICDVIMSSVFEACHKVVPYEHFLSACQYDVCETNRTAIGCTTLETYADACAKAGVCLDWRKDAHGQCDYDCTSPKVYQACGPVVESTCDYRYNQEFIHDCKSDFTTLTKVEPEGCYCPNGTFLFNPNSNECLPTCDICSLPNGKWKKVNDRWEEGCDECQCEETLQISCNRKSCPRLPPISCDQEGQVKVTETLGCCSSQRCECAVKQCPDAPTCPLGFSLHTTMGVCCHNYTCVPKDMCVYNNHEYTVGDSVPVNPCEQCTCGPHEDARTHLHKVVCELLPCDTQCQQGYEYQAVSGQCCGSCVQTSCVVMQHDNTTHSFKPGDIWSPKGDSCVTYECVKIGKQFITLETKTLCPAYDPAECMPGTETIASDGCCRSCVKRDRPCNIISKEVHLENQGCRSKELVNVTTCAGACSNYASYSMQLHTAKRSCSCCQEVSTSQRYAQLSCANGTELTFAYTHIHTCACLKTECRVLGLSDVVAPITPTNRAPSPT